MSSENLNIQFSVSHSKNVVAMAVTTDGRRVGIDCEVEKRRTKDACLKLAKRYFRKGEAVERIETALAKEEELGRRLEGAGSRWGGALGRWGGVLGRWEGAGRRLELVKA